MNTSLMTHVAMFKSALASWMMTTESLDSWFISQMVKASCFVRHVDPSACDDPVYNMKFTGSLPPRHEVLGGNIMEDVVHTSTTTFPRNVTFHI
jgi:hypothetical protein